MTNKYAPGNPYYGDSSPTSALLGTNQVVFCVNSVLFQSCGLLLEVPSGLTTSSVMKIRQECPNRTAISLSVWVDIAINVLGMRESVASSIFDVVYALTGGYTQYTAASLGSSTGSGNGSPEVRSPVECRQEESRSLLKKMGGTVDVARWPVVSATRQIGLPALIIFLLAQLVVEQTQRVLPGESERERVMASVRQHLHDYISVVAITRPGRLTLSDSKELRILLREFVNGVEQPFGTSIGFLWPRSEKTIDITILSQFIRPRITVPSELAATSRSSPFSNNIVVKGLQGTICIPTCPVVTYSPKLAISSSYTVEKCSQTSFYVTSDLPHTRLTQLVNCTVALGPVGGVLYIDRCENTNISALCTAVVVNRCRNVNIFICTNSPPVLCQLEGSENSENVRFAPYNSHYSTLEEHLANSGVNPMMNLWNVGIPSPHCILPPDEFTPVCFPVAPHTSAVVTTRTNPCPPPPPYATAMERRVRRFQETSRQLREAYERLEADGRKDLADELRGKVHTLFVDWLRRVGQERVLASLLRKNANGQS
ncbi:Tubulin cofactor C domain-containing protein 1 [Trypanosoma equiperdum]|uniref:C-CAP/cofactor C-like domain-containing protein n=2 Tax=Trypanozoon TaxID=39700 RepID=Q386R6_TRYB2|nr:hypothetical protein, conserved [Trypanosoma brucei brucei TREU927]EAN79215.1 hypothetical protein, conserved [Trypanosoma brucei brucei TREU927]SCU73015.1 Tubulin cofactor C domain-containing protein 1 [Trypanosoma equiperdum]